MKWLLSLFIFLLSAGFTHAMQDSSFLEKWDSYVKTNRPSAYIHYFKSNGGGNKRSYLFSKYNDRFYLLYYKDSKLNKVVKMDSINLIALAHKNHKELRQLKKKSINKNSSPIPKTQQDYYNPLVISRTMAIKCGGFHFNHFAFNTPYNEAELGKANTNTDHLLTKLAAIMEAAVNDK